MTIGVPERPPLAERVAKRSGVDRARVDTALAAHAVPVVAVPTAVRSLRVLRVRLVGNKIGVSSAGPFDRTFELPTGVVMAVAPNLRGKTSLLEVITLCLRGTPRELQHDVLGWLHSVECDVELNGNFFGFRIRLSSGSITSARVYQAQSEAQLATHLLGTAARKLVDATSAEEYSAEVEALMLDRLGLEPIVNTTSRSDDGVQTHGWPSYFSALYPPSGGEKVLIGEIAMGGMAGRLLTVFLDLPNAALLTRVRAAHDVALKKLNAERERAKAAAAQSGQLRQEQLTVLQRSQDALASLSPVGSERSATAVAGSVSALADRLADAETDRREAAALHRQARDARWADERALNNLRESVVAQRLFHGLDPTACPRCETPVDGGRREREVNDHVCAVCTTPVGPNADDVADDVVAELESALTASRSAEEEAARALAAIETRITSLTSELEEAESDLRAARDARETGQRAELLTAIARAEGALAVLPEQLPEPQADPDVAVLQALATELDDDLKRGSAAALDELGMEITSLARTFGIESVESVTVDRSARLKISKGGAEGRSFSSQSPGERLRLRIATILALLRVGARRGIATHPGLLMLDSLRAEEVQDSDAHAVLEALVTVAGDTPGLQLITTTADETLPVGRLDEAAVLRPLPGTDVLW
jgi:hypothetical protein